MAETPEQKKARIDRMNAATEALRKKNKAAKAKQEAKANWWNRMKSGG